MWNLEGLTGEVTIVYTPYQALLIEDKTGVTPNANKTLFWYLEIFVPTGKTAADFPKNSPIISLQL